MGISRDVDLRPIYRQSSTPLIDYNNPYGPRSEPSSYVPSADSRLIYVSSTGNDGTAVNTTVAAQTDAFDPQGTVLPYLTIAAAVAQLRDGFPDWILLKRGEVWTDQVFGSSFSLSGRSVSEPLLLTYYGTTGDRPLVKAGASTCLGSNGNVTDHLTLYGLDLYAHKRDPLSPDYVVVTTDDGTGLRMVGGGANFTIDECIVRYFKNNLNVQSFGGGLYSNFIMKRSIIVDAYIPHAIAHSQGAYFDGVEGILIEESLWDHNGWHDTVVGATANKFNHNQYIQSNNSGVVVRRNIVSKGSSHGIYARPGGQIEDNLVVNNSISIAFGYNAANPMPAGGIGNAVDNVVLSGKLMDPLGVNPSISSAVWGLEIEIDAMSLGAEVFMTNNIVANAVDYGLSNVDIRVRAGAVYSGNIGFDWNASGETPDAGWSHPTHDVGDYMASKGLTATLDAFLLGARNRALGEWDIDYTATEANNYIRAGF